MLLHSGRRAQPQMDTRACILGAEAARVQTKERPAEVPSNNHGQTPARLQTRAACK